VAVLVGCGLGGVTMRVVDGVGFVGGRVVVDGFGSGRYDDPLNGVFVVVLASGVVVVDLRVVVVVTGGR
jgi:hypothetical protein